jgi:hypothetical protein
MATVIDRDGRITPTRRHWDAVKQDFQDTNLMEPEQFLAIWDIDHEALAKLVGCSITTVRGWFSTGRSHRNPQTWHKIQLAYWNHRWSCIKVCSR